MRYTTEFKLMCVELYRQGKWVKTPKGIKTANFRNKDSRAGIVSDRLADRKHCITKHYKAWSPEEKRIWFHDKCRTVSGCRLSMV